MQSQGRKSVINPMERKLKSIYYNPEHPAGFASLEKLVKASGYSRAKVKAWLKAQPTYTLHRQARKRYSTRKYIVHDIDQQWQADLADVSLIARENDGYHFILTVIDIFSRYAWARPLKNKTAEGVVKAFKSIFQEGRVPQRLQTDAGREFVNAPLQNELKKHNIEFMIIQSATKAAFAERFNRTLKNKLYRYFTMSNKRNWTHVLQKAVHAYNHSKHRAIGCKPADVSPANVDEVREKAFKRRPESTKKSDIKVGDKVRISKMKHVFAKGYLPNWTEEIFTVTSINRKSTPISYKLKDYNGEEVKGSFYREEIEVVIHDDDTYLVEKVLRTEKRGNEEWCFVKWEGYPSTMNSWVRKSDITMLADRTRV